jgi:midasin (ATPase involved in ribosome maturation)
MNEKVFIKGNRVKVLEDYYDNDQVAILVILFIIKYSLSGNTKSIPLKKIAFILDCIKKQVPESKKSSLLSVPWSISDSLRKNVILALKKDLIVICESNSKITLKLSNKGVEFIDKIESLDVMPDLRKLINIWSKIVSSNELNKQLLIW